MRVLIGSVCHESNTFTPFPTTKADFWTLYGDELLSDRWGFDGHPLGGITSVLRANHVELVPTLATVAMPGGVVERSVYEAFKRAILDRAHDVDGVCLFLHGAMRAQGVDYCELDYRIFALKRGLLTAPLQAISERNILALTPGATNCRVAEMEFVRLNRPAYPLDLDATWMPGESF